MFSIRVAGFHAFAHCLWNPRGENQDSNGHRPIRDSLAHCYAMYISLFSGCSNIDNNLLGALRDILLRKYCFSFGFCPNYLTLASPPKLDNLYNFFPMSKFKIWKTVKDQNYYMYYMLYYIYNLKKQFKVQIISILEEIDSFIDQKCTSWKCDKKFGQVPPPRSFGKIQKNSSISLRRTSLTRNSPI